jgi:Mn2+/Fe2+ NRAMP family transporter
VTRTRNPIIRFLAILGPGLITGASDDDPSGIGTYAVAGASSGFATLWTGPASTSPGRLALLD